MEVRFDKTYVKKDIISAIDYITEDLMAKYSGLDFTIERRTENGNAFFFIIHDKQVFRTPDFENYFIDILRSYLWPKNILNITFICEEKK